MSPVAIRTVGEPGFTLAPHGSTSTTPLMLGQADQVHAAILRAILPAIRRAADLTQVDLAAQMGVAQSETSRTETRCDMLLSTLTSYLSSADDDSRVVVTVNGRDIEPDLSTFAG